MVTLEDRQAYHDRGSAHDWLYEMSDSAGVHEKGRREQRSLSMVADNSIELAEIYDAWATYKFNDGPKPERPS